MTRYMLIAVMALGLCMVGIQAGAQTHTGNVTVTGQAITLQSGADGNTVSGNFIVGSTNVKQFFWSNASNFWNFNANMKVDGTFFTNLVNVGQAVDTLSGNVFILFGGTNQEQLRWNSATSSFQFTDDVAILGTGTVNVLQILGGADFAEDFAVNGDHAMVDPGSVVSIDATKPGELKLSGKAYDKAVAGIVSGAGGLNTGMRMGQSGSIADGDHPIALSGRVYCKVDATLAAIEPGDLLTTSNTPGHAMKVLDHSMAAGAIIGKAMTPLAQGEKGLVLVLVSLQ